MTKAKAITNDIVQNTDTQKILFRIIILSSVILFAGYIYLIGSITFNVIARKTLETKVSALSAHVNELDLSYLDSVNKMNKEYAASLGFVDARENIFASRNINNVAIR